MQPRITTLQLALAHQEAIEADSLNRFQNRLYCEHMDKVGMSLSWEEYVQAEQRIQKISG